MTYDLTGTAPDDVALMIRIALGRVCACCQALGVVSETDPLYQGGYCSVRCSRCGCVFTDGALGDPPAVHQLGVGLACMLGRG